MKRFIALTICLFALLNVTKADDDKPITVNELPKKAQEFIKQFFPKNEVSYAKMEKDLWDKKYDVVFVNGEKVEFNKNGEWEEVDCKFSAVPEPIIPESIRTTLAKQYPQSKILKIDRDNKGYEVKLNNKLEIKFNTRFQIVEIDN